MGYGGGGGGGGGGTPAVLEDQVEQEVVVEVTPQ